MMSTISIRVLNKDIENGVPCSTASCPIAKAVRRKFNNKKKIRVTRYEIKVGKKLYKGQDFSLEKFIIDFDRGNQVKSQYFKLVEVK